MVEAVGFDHEARMAGAGPLYRILGSMTPLLVNKRHRLTLRLRLESPRVGLKRDGYPPDWGCSHRGSNVEVHGRRGWGSVIEAEHILYSRHIYQTPLTTLASFNLSLPVLHRGSTSETHCFVGRRSLLRSQNPPTS